MCTCSCSFFTRKSWGFHATVLDIQQEDQPQDHWHYRSQGGQHQQDVAHQVLGWLWIKFHEKTQASFRLRAKTCETCLEFNKQYQDLCNIESLLIFLRDPIKQE